MINSAVAISKEVVAAGMEVEKAADSLRMQPKGVEAILKQTEAGAHANEIVGAVPTKFLGISQMSIEGCDDGMGRCTNELNGLEIENHALARKIQSLVDAIPDPETAFMPRPRSA